MGKNLYQVMHAVINYMDNTSIVYLDLMGWCKYFAFRLYPHEKIEHELKSYITQEIKRISKVYSVYELFALVEYIFTQVPKIDNLYIKKYIKEHPIPYGKFDKTTNQIIWYYKPPRDPDDEVVINYVKQLCNPIFKMKIVKELMKDINRLTHQDVLIEHYIQQIDDILSVENLSDLSIEERKQILVKLKYILDVSEDCVDDIINICRTDVLKPFQNTTLKNKLYQLKKIQQDIDNKLGRKGEIESESVRAEPQTNKKTQKFRKAIEILFNYIEFRLKYSSTSMKKSFDKDKDSAGNYVFYCKEIINKITGQQELVEIYQNLVAVLCTTENWVWLTKEQKQIVKHKLEAITKEKVLYHGALCTVKVFDPTIPLSKSILQTKINQLEEIAVDLEKMYNQAQNN